MTFSRSDFDAAVAHAGRVAPLLAATFGPIPVVAGFLPDAAQGRVVYEVDVAGKAPASIATVRVATHGQTRSYLALTQNGLLWQAHRGALEFHSWAPQAADPLVPRFARMLLSASGTATGADVAQGAAVLRGLLEGRGLRGIAVLDGLGGIAVWLPLADASSFEELRAGLHAFADDAAARNPKLLTTARPLSERGNLVHVGVDSNAPGRWSALPYSLRAVDGLPMVTPVAGDVLGTVHDGVVTASSSESWFAARGDVFATLLTAIGQQPAARLAVPGAARTLAIELPDELPDPRGRIIAAALAILADGKARDADTLLAEALARDLVPKSTTRKYMYTALTEYISRQKGHQRKPLIVQDIDRKFRANHPADDWPAPKVPLPTRTSAPDTAELTARLQSTARGHDPAAFETAVCDTFAGLGFVATHVGGEAAPDGYVDAPLGPLGYRVMLECKTAAGVVLQPDAVEAAKYVQPYHAQYAALIGPAFSEETALASELQTHGVAAITVDDLVSMLQNGCDPYELRTLFEPGFALDRLSDLLWERDHGEAKRVAVVCDVLLEAGRREQLTAAHAADPASAPRIDEDAAMMLVDQVVVGEEGSQRACTRDEIRAAFEYLTNPLVGRAVWADDEHKAIVVARGLD